MKSVTPQVRGNVCTDPARPLYPPMTVGSELWFSWLKEFNVESFHFESNLGKFTARREERSSSINEYWYAYRKIKGKLRKVYVGTKNELTSDRLEQVATEISQSGEDYFYSRPRYIARKQQSQVAATNQQNVELALEAKGYPINKLQSCLTDSSEVEALKTEVEQLRSQLAEFQSAEKNLLDQVRDLTSEQLRAASILNQALTLKANSGGAIKEKIREALKLIDDI